MKQIGRELPRLEARAKVSGRAEYTHNLRLPGMLYGKVIRSTVPHGIIRRIDTTAARTPSSASAPAASAAMPTSAPVAIKVTSRPPSGSRRT